MNKKQPAYSENPYYAAYENIYTILEANNIEKVLSMEAGAATQIGLGNLIYKNP